MVANIKSLDAHEQPSDYLRRKWKAYSRATAEEVEKTGDIDEVDGSSGRPSFSVAGTLPSDRTGRAFAEFLADKSPVDGDSEDEQLLASLAPGSDVPIYFHPLLPGLLIVPNLVPPRVQKRLLDRMVHRDLSCRNHQTNMHPFYHVPYPAPKGASFFSYPPSAEACSRDTGAVEPGTFTPIDPTVHKPLAIRQVLDRRLHWVTLGGQYDWTRRVYPEADGCDEEADEMNRTPTFPPDLSRLLAGLFPDTDAQAAIVNFYTPGDTMMMHRDVSEETDKGLISLSIGCDALFMAAPTGEFAEAAQEARADACSEDAGTGDGTKANEPKSEPYILLRLRSGDAMYMTGHSRFAWHGVPKVIKGTCPDYLADWPAGEHKDGRYEAWRGWMRNKRVNLNVRQMRD